MVTNPTVTIQPEQYGMGLSALQFDNIDVVVGVSSQGDPNTLYSFSDPNDITKLLGYGPLAETVAETVKGGLTYAVRVATANLGVKSAVTPGGANTGDGTLTLNGDPLTKTDVVVVVTRAGSVAGNDAAFKYSLDGGVTYSAEIALVAAYPLPGTGVTLAFADGVAFPTFAANDSFAFDTTPPTASLAELNAAIDKVFGYNFPWEMLVVAGTVTPAVAVAVLAKMDEATAKKRFGMALVQTRDVDDTTDAGSVATWSTNLRGEWEPVVGYRLAAVAGHATKFEGLSARYQRTGALASVVRRLKEIPVSTHPGEVERGPLPSILSIVYDHDATPGLDGAGFTTLRSIPGLTGTYITRGVTRAPVGSDLRPIQYLRTLNKACRIAYFSLVTKFLNKRVRVNPVTGFIDERDAVLIEAYVEGKLRAEMTNDTSDIDVQVARTENILVLQGITVRVALLGFAYLEEIVVPVGFTNPALQPVVAAPAEAPAA